jgi:hypothetical protein
MNRMDRADQNQAKRAAIWDKKMLCVEIISDLLQNTFGFFYRYYIFN